MAAELLAYAFQRAILFDADLISKFQKRRVGITSVECDQLLEGVTHLGCSLVRSILDVHRQQEANERDCTGDADNAIRAYGCAKESYFESLGLSHDIVSISFRLACRVEHAVPIGSTLTAADNDIRRRLGKRRNLNELDEPEVLQHSREKTAEVGSARSLCC